MGVNCTDPRPLEPPRIKFLSKRVEPKPYATLTPRVSVVRNPDAIAKVMVLAGGPDQERPVSLESATHVTRALTDAGYDVRQRQIAPDDLSALDEWTTWAGRNTGPKTAGVVFPVLHGPWGEGGPLQHILEERDIPYVGCTAQSAALCIDKYQTKRELVRHGLPTPRFEAVATGQPMTLQPPVVIKAPNEGSSFDMAICMDSRQAQAARQELAQRHPALLVEQYIAGKELAVSVIGVCPQDPENPASLDADHAGHRDQAMPPIHIAPATRFYDYHAKYYSADTRYFVGPDQIDLPTQVLAQVQQLALDTHHALGCRHMSRTDFIVDENDQPWILETNTIPGFTAHSLLPMAAAAAGLTMALLADRLVRLAMTAR